MLHVSMYIGQPELTPLVAVSQLGVIDPGKMEDGCLHVVHMDRLLGDVPPILVGRAVGHTRLNAASSHPP